MAKDSVILSPEYRSCGSREAPADGPIDTGSFVKYSATGVTNATAAAALTPKLIATENISTAQELDGIYLTGQNVHMASLPCGVLLQASAAAGTYAPGASLEIGANGWLTALAAGVAVAVIPPSQASLTVEDGQSLVVELV